MTHWRKTIRVKHLLTEETDPATVKAVADKMIPILKAEGAPITLIEKAQTLGKDGDEVAYIVFNEGMSRLYDWADAERIWID